MGIRILILMTMRILVMMMIKMMTVMDLCIQRPYQPARARDSLEDHNLNVISKSTSSMTYKMMNYRLF